ncbi:hypothetical protein LN042_16835 [Kitasatospora sp. RB6PN24]|uniref:hypothetical protein n=1 Tax=Kitasatospora humi TaxID=2893891 RepID=UPI001E3DEFEA|nr:hypothetical protein [Kitasatospora humi]MCC9308728.1 hypothetical protein [Kitasatospora humi]
MDDKTTATHPAAPTGRPTRPRRALAAAALLLSVAAAVTACGSSGGAKSAAGGASSTSSTSAAASAGASTGPSGSASAAPSAGSPAAPSGAPATGQAGASGGGSGTLPGGNPSAPRKSPAPGSPLPVDPIHPATAFKPENYLASGNQLTVFFTGGICDKYALKVNEKPGGVVGVDVVISEPAPSGQNCPALAKRQSVVGTLSQPLNGRSVVSLRDGTPVPLESAPQGGPVSAGN